MKRVAVAMSGGVDSTATALFLKQRGYAVTGVTFFLTEDSEAAVKDAKLVCDILGIEHVLLDYRLQFNDNVIEPFIRSYLDGETPNPCIFCNKSIKFGEFFEFAEKNNFDFIATGHYAKNVCDESGIYHLLMANNKVKDQTYVLYQLTQENLTKILLPLGECELTKPEIRELLTKEGITLANRPDSQDICFIPDGDYAKFIEQRRGKAENGFFIDEQGEKLGEHKGLYKYTIGQRKGLGISLGAPAFVTSINPDKNTVTLSIDSKKLLRDKIYCHSSKFCQTVKEGIIHCDVKLRYAHKPSPAEVIICEGNMLEIRFKEPQRAPTAGQSAVLYQGDEVLGGAIISK